MVNTNNRNTRQNRSRRAPRRPRPNNSFQIVRKFKYFETKALDAASTSWGDNHSFLLENATIQMSKVGGSDLIKTYDRYRVSNVQLRISIAPSNDQSLNPYYAMKVYSSVDLDGNDYIDSYMVTTANNSRLHKLMPSGSAVVANFSPRLAGVGPAGSLVLPPNSNYLSTQSKDAIWNGVNLYLVTPGTHSVGEVKVIFEWDITVSLRDPIISGAMNHFLTGQVDNHQTVPSSLIGVTFTIPSLSRNYTIASADDVNGTVTATYGSSGSDTVTMQNLKIRIADGTYTAWSGPAIAGWDS